jgi:hypothetical protein
MESKVSKSKQLSLSLFQPQISKRNNHEIITKTSGAQKALQKAEAELEEALEDELL